MFPDTQHPPTCVSQCARHQPVTSLIRFEFYPPIIPAFCGVARVLWAAMPETTVHKNCKSGAPENEIGLANQLLVTPPTCDAL